MVIKFINSKCRSDSVIYEICKRCGKLFKKNKKIYCESCFQINKREYDIITDYISQYPNSSVLNIITETGVSLKSINCLIEDGDIVYVIAN